MSKPLWKDAPEWAMWLAQDKDGWWSWWNKQPVPEDRAESWSQGDPMIDWQYLDVSVGDLPDNWKEQLEERP